MSTNSISFKMNFKNSTYVRTMTFNDVSTSTLAGVKQKVKYINEELLNNGYAPATTEGQALAFGFIDPDVMNVDNPGAGGFLSSLSDVTITQTDVTKIPLF